MTSLTAELGLLWTSVSSASITTYRFLEIVCLLLGGGVLKKRQGIGIL